MEHEVDLVVLGGGGAGVYAAVRAAKLGVNVILVEKGRMGGVCLNWGGPATKTLTSTVELLKNVKNGNKIGLHGSVSIDWSELKQYKDGFCARFAKFGEIARARAYMRQVIEQQGKNACSSGMNSSRFSPQLCKW